VERIQKPSDIFEDLVRIIVIVKVTSYLQLTNKNTGFNGITIQNGMVS